MVEAKEVGTEVIVKRTCGACKKERTWTVNQQCQDHPHLLGISCCASPFSSLEDQPPKFHRPLSHVVNKPTNLDDPPFNKCSHGALQPRKWLKIGMFIIDCCTSVCCKQLECQTEGTGAI